MREAAPILALLGLRATGKSTVARALGAHFGVAVLDLDEQVTARAGNEGAPASTTGELLVAIGEPRFRALEARTLAAVVERPGPFVLATGGGVVESAAAREGLAASCLCLWLDATDEVLVARLAATSAGARPPLTELEPAAEVEHLRARREAHYAALASTRFDTGAAGVDEVVSAIAETIALDRDGGTLFRTKGQGSRTIR